MERSWKITEFRMCIPGLEKSWKSIKKILFGSWENGGISVYFFPKLFLAEG